MPNLFRITVIGGGLGILLIAVALNLDGDIAVVVFLAGIATGFFGVAGVFLGAFFALESLLVRLGIIRPSYPASGDYWRGYNDGWDDRRH